MFKSDGNVIHFSAPKGMFASGTSDIYRSKGRIVVLTDGFLQ